METLTVVGFGLAILFLTIIGILANSLRHRNKEVEALRGQVVAIDSTLDNLKEEFSAARVKMNNRVSMEGEAKDRYRRELSVSIEKSSQLEVDRLKSDLTATKSRLSNCYERVGKRFQKVGKV